MPAPWTSLPLLAIDFESTGVDPFSARIVEGAAVEVQPDGTVTNTWRRIINPGCEIPEEAAAIHGITTERAQAEGVEPAVALAELVDIVWAHIVRHDGLAALTMFNARYDLPLVLTESSRHGVDFPVFAAVLDPYLIDRMVERYVKGKRKLTLVAERYGVDLGDAAHGATADATAAGQVMWQILGRHPEIGSHSLAELWLRQVKGHEKDRVSFESWMRSNVSPDIEIVGGWPVPVRAEPPKSPAGQRPGNRTGPSPDPEQAQGDDSASASAGSPPAAVPMTAAQNRRVHALIAKARPGEDRHQVMTELAGRPISSARDLTDIEADRIIHALDQEAKTAS